MSNRGKRRVICILEQNLHLVLLALRQEQAEILGTEEKGRGAEMATETERETEKEIVQEMLENTVVHLYKSEV